MRPKLIPLLAAALLSGSLAACSSISDSISSPFKSSSASSKSLESSESAFRQDVEDYTSTFAKSNGDLDQFMTGISSLASKRGISNWESDPQTYVAIGKGLRKAGADPGKVEAYVVTISRGDSAKATAIRQGYGR